MTPEGLKNWRAVMGYSRQEAADVLDISLNTYSNYERGVRYESEGIQQEVRVPKVVEFACAAVCMGIKKYNGEALEI